MKARLVRTVSLSILLAGCGLAAGSSSAIGQTTVRFAVIGDYGVAGTAEKDVADLVKGWNPDLIITTGDNNYSDGTATTIDRNIGQYYQQFIYPYIGTFGSGEANRVNRFFPSLGNHDWYTAGAVPYLDYFALPGNERYYDFVWGPVHFFAIDSDAKEPDGTSATSKQATWLKNRLAASTARWKIVYFHHPPYSSGNHGSSTYMRWPFQAWGASAVLSGHDHTYERISINGFPYFVNGLGGKSLYAFGTPVSGSQFRYNANYGAQLVEASNSAIAFRLYNRAGTLIDSLTIGGTTLPASPTNLTAAAASASSVYLSWSDVASNEDGYLVERSTSTTGFSQIASIGANSTGYPDSGLTAGVTYYYRVRAVNTVGTSGYSNTAVVAVPHATLTASPTSQIPTATSNITVSFTASSARTATDWIGFYRKGDPDNMYRWWRYTSGLASGSFTLTCPVTAGDYEFRYFANNSYIRKANSNTTSVSKPSGTFALSASDTGTALRVEWAVPAGRPLKDWIGLYLVGAPDNQIVRWFYASGLSAGRVDLTRPTAGSYEFRYFHDSSWMKLTTSNSVTIR